MKKYILKLAIVIIFLCPIGTVSAYDKLPLKMVAHGKKTFQILPQIPQMR
ncbi:hypothetical protein [Leuconostoc citreum]|nr:hypothetical protein [Leuconostoc citreum]TDG66922.1 hypothetical protein C5L21_000196 [Leuconostoc citreum]